MNPEILNKYEYIEKTPTWWVRLFYVVGLLAWGLVVWGYIESMSPDPMYRWVLLPIVGFFTLYTVSNFSLNLFYRQFDLAKHLQLMKSYWRTRPEPSVDVFLPICGEEMEILESTWKYVARLNYGNKKYTCSTIRKSTAKSTGARQRVTVLAISNGRTKER